MLAGEWKSWVVFEVALSPGPSLRGRKGLVHTNCACTHLYPESEYVVYSRKILGKLHLSICNYVTFLNRTLALGQQKRQSLFTGLDHWTGILDWTTGLTFGPPPPPHTQIVYASLIVGCVSSICNH